MEATSPRPTGRAALQQRWSQLLFLHWEVPLPVLAARLPPGLDVDTYEGRAFVGLVPFTMSGIRPPWAPALPWLSRFHEVNVRTYVRHRGEPGVWFLSLDAANPVGALLGRVLWKLPYHWARMSLERRGGLVHYRSRRLAPGPRGAGLSLRYGPGGLVRPACPGTLEHFLVERYVLFAPARGRVHRGRVHHAPYPLQAGRFEALEEDLVASAGLGPFAGPPLTHYAEGVDVEVFPLRSA
jgi:uncharacterized protein YqjF (DUF2071 family)